MDANSSLNKEVPEVSFDVPIVKEEEHDVLVKIPNVQEDVSIEIPNKLEETPDETDVVHYRLKLDKSALYICGACKKIKQFEEKMIRHITKKCKKLKHFPLCEKCKNSQYMYTFNDNIIYYHPNCDVKNNNN